VGPLTQDDATGRLHRSIPTNPAPARACLRQLCVNAPTRAAARSAAWYTAPMASLTPGTAALRFPARDALQRARNHARLARAHARRRSRQLAHALTRAGQVGAGLWALLAILQLAGILDVGALELAAHALVAVAGLVVLAGATILLARLIWTVLQVILGVAIILAAGLACLAVLGMIVGR